MSKLIWKDYGQDLHYYKSPPPYGHLTQGTHYSISGDIVVEVWPGHKPEEASLTLAHELAHRSRQPYLDTHPGKRGAYDTLARFINEVDTWKYAKDHGWAYDKDRTRFSLMTYLEGLRPESQNSAKAYAYKKLGLRFDNV
jgi:hypothetical protein